MVDQAMMDGKGVRTVRDLCYHREKGAGGNGSKHVKGTRRYDNSPTSKIYTTWPRILSDRNIFWTMMGGRTTAGCNAPGAFLVFFIKVTRLNISILSRPTKSP